MVGVEGGRPKRACAMDGKIDYAGTDQVPGWTVRFVFFFLFSLFSSHLRAMMMMNFKLFFRPFILLTPRLNDLRLRVLTTFLSLSLSLYETRTTTTTTKTGDAKDGHGKFE